MSENGVLLVNLGTPETPENGDVGQFLTAFLSDPRVVDLPRWLWIPLLRGVIIPLRRSRTAKAYQEIWMEDGSPLMVYSKALKAGLERKMTGTARVELAMRYGKPEIQERLAMLRDAGVERLAVLPMYPQYSVTTTASVFDAVDKSLQSLNWQPDLQRIEQYSDQPGWVQSIASSIQYFSELHGKADKILFSMHGIPRRLVKAGDPYEAQCQQGFDSIVEILGRPEDCLLTYQSRVGREPWLQPYTDEVIKELAASGVKYLQVVSPGFSVDCLETLEEIAIRYRALFLAAGGERFEYIPALNDSELHVELLAAIVEQTLSG